VVQDASEEDDEAARERGRGAYNQAGGGEDFAGLAKEFWRTDRGMGREDYLFGRGEKWSRNLKTRSFSLEPGQFTKLRQD
jgi:hypothetical protein